jgi:excisionase family DNA binding protein
MPEARNLISFKTAVARLGCGRTKAYRLIREKKLIAYKDGPRTMVDADSVTAYQASLPKLELRSD